MARCVQGKREVHRKLYVLAFDSRNIRASVYLRVNIKQRAESNLKGNSCEECPQQFYNIEG